VRGPLVPSFEESFRIFVEISKMADILTFMDRRPDRSSEERGAIMRTCEVCERFMADPAALGRRYADEAIAAGGEFPFDDDGCCLLPEIPLEGDYAALAEDLGRAPSTAEVVAMELAFMERAGARRAALARATRREV
jgi:hypothetical protein